MYGSAIYQVVKKHEVFSKSAEDFIFFFNTCRTVKFVNLK